MQTRLLARRSSAASFMGREKPPSKDGTAQRRAKEVEGLKDFVGNTSFHFHLMGIAVSRKGVQTMFSILVGWRDHYEAKGENVLDMRFSLTSHTSAAAPCSPLSHFLLTLQVWTLLTPRSN